MLQVQLLVKKNDSINLTKKIQSLIDNENLRLLLGKNAYTRFIKNYTLEIFEKKLLGIFNAL